MLVSWNWLADYLRLSMTAEELTLRLAMSGLNHEGTTAVGDDLAIDLEVTSNRPDCLGHLGVAREIAVLWGLPLSIADPQPAATGPSVQQAVQVRIDCPELCPRYTARVLRGVTIGPSPGWLVSRLATVGMPTVNNVVDATNYVLTESGQPLHAFDFRQIRGSAITVREALPGELFSAIDHREYALQPGMCVIADRDRSVALGGVMGGVDSEVSPATTDLLIEAAVFQPLSIRNTARQLKLHSPSSYRFERGVDWSAVDWASRRCCQLILEIAGGDLAEGVIDVVAQPPPDKAPITLRWNQISRVLGIEIDPAEIARILHALGLETVAHDERAVHLQAPSWRRDLEREIDLIEEVARIHGYDQIPEDVGVPMVSSHRRDAERVLDRIRHVMTAAGFDEAVTTSVVPESCSQLGSPWTDAPALRSHTAMLENADRLRRSLLPSLLLARQRNESLANPEIELFETAKVYLPRDRQLPEEPWMLALTSGRDVLAVKGVLESLLKALNPQLTLQTEDCDVALFDPRNRCQLLCQGHRVGFLGRLHPDLQRSKTLALRSATTLAELRIDLLEQLATLIPQYRARSPFPAISRDINLIVDDQVRWSQVADAVVRSAGPHLESITYRETYRDAQKDGTGRKRLLFSFQLRSPDRTLTGEEADDITRVLVATCAAEFQGQLLA